MPSPFSLLSQRIISVETLLRVHPSHPSSFFFILLLSVYVSFTLKNLLLCRYRYVEPNFILHLMDHLVLKIKHILSIHFSTLSYFKIPNPLLIIRVFSSLRCIKSKTLGAGLVSGINEVRFRGGRLRGLLFTRVVHHNVRLHKWWIWRAVLRANSKNFIFLLAKDRSFGGTLTPLHHFPVTGNT